MQITRLFFASYIFLLTHSTGLFAQKEHSFLPVTIRIDLEIGEGVQDYEARIPLKVPGNPIGYGT